MKHKYEIALNKKEITGNSFCEILTKYNQSVSDCDKINDLNKFIDDNSVILMEIHEIIVEVVKSNSGIYAGEEYNCLIVVKILEHIKKISLTI